MKLQRIEPHNFPFLARKSEVLAVDCHPDWEQMG